VARCGAFAAVLILGLACGGCSLSYQLESFSLFSKNEKSEEKVETTGSVSETKKAEVPPEADLAFTREAVAEMLTRGGKDTSIPWENPRTGARGTVTAIASAYNQDGMTCRDFLASYVHSGSESWLQGEACRARAGKWEVRSLKPWRRT